MTTTSLIFLIGLAIAFLIIYASVKAPICPKCGTRMSYDSYASYGYEIDCLVCPKCHHREVLNVEDGER